jgi:hypothetical protein
MWWGVSTEVFFLFFFSQFCNMKKKIWKFSKSLTKSSQIYTRKTKKVTLPILFVQKTTKFVRKKKPRPLESACEIGWGCTRMCILVTFGHVGHQVLMQKWRTWEDIRCSENADFTSVGPVYTRTIWSWYWVQDWFLASMRQV